MTIKLRFQYKDVKFNIKFDDKNEIEGFIIACDIVLKEERSKTVSLKDSNKNEIDWTQYENYLPEISSKENPNKHLDLYNFSSDDFEISEEIFSDPETEVLDELFYIPLYTFDLTIDGKIFYHLETTSSTYFSGLSIGLTFFGYIIEQCISNVKYNNVPMSKIEIAKIVFDSIYG